MCVIVIVFLRIPMVCMINVNRNGFISTGASKETLLVIKDCQ